MKVSAAGVNLIKAFENCLQPIGDGKFRPYLCPAGVSTIGWGHTNHHGRKFLSTDVWTQAECDAALAEDLAGFEKAVTRLVKVPMAQYEFDALVSFAYNCGEGNLAKSTLLKKLNAGDRVGAAGEFAKWNKGAGKVLRGLIRRRASEALLFQGIPDINYDGKADGPKRPVPDKMPQKVDKPEGKPATKSKTLWSVLAQIGAALSSVGAALASLDWKVVAVLGVIIIALALFIGRERIKKLVGEGI